MSFMLIGQPDNETIQEYIFSRLDGVEDWYMQAYAQIKERDDRVILKQCYPFRSLVVFDLSPVVTSSTLSTQISLHEHV